MHKHGLSTTADLVRYIYILEVDNHQKSRFYGLQRCYYTGQTHDLCVRLREHLNSINSKFLTKYFRYASKRLVYVEPIHGTEFEAMRRERQVKNLKAAEKRTLITSPTNHLVKYVPLKAIVMRDHADQTLAVCLSL